MLTEDAPTSSKNTIIRASDGSIGKVVEVKAGGYTLQMTDGSFKFAAHRELRRDPGDRHLVLWTPAGNKTPTAKDLKTARTLLAEARKADGLDAALSAWRRGEIAQAVSQPQTPELGENDFQKGVAVEVRRLLGMPADAEVPKRETAKATPAAVSKPDEFQKGVEKHLHAMLGQKG